MSLFSKLFKKNNDTLKEVKELSESDYVEDIEDADEIAAVIAATIAAMDEEEEIVAAITAAISVILGKSTSEFIVRNIKRTSEIDSIWAHEGRMKLFR